VREQRSARTDNARKKLPVLLHSCNEVARSSSFTGRVVYPLPRSSPNVDARIMKFPAECLRLCLPCPAAHDVPFPSSIAISTKKCTMANSRHAGVLHTTLIIRLSSVGDIVLSSPLVRSLHARHPAAGSISSPSQRTPTCALQTACCPRESNSPRGVVRRVTPSPPCYRIFRLRPYHRHSRQHPEPSSLCGNAARGSHTQAAHRAGLARSVQDRSL